MYSTKQAGKQGKRANALCKKDRISNSVFYSNR